MGRRLPSDLVAWLIICNGLKERGYFGDILPTHHTPLPAEKMLPRLDMLRGIYADHPRPGEHDPAGTRSSEWLDAFLPISDTGTDLDLVVDLRDGDLHGCVGEFSAEAGGFGTPYWMSVAEMLADVADALTLNHPVLLDYTRRLQAASPWTKVRPREPFLDEGTLYWTTVYSDELTIGGRD